MPQEESHKLWAHVVTIIDDHGEKVVQDPGHIQFISSINYDQFEKVMSFNSIANNMVQNGDNEIIW